jgi:hypothetical protein
LDRLHRLEGLKVLLFEATPDIRERACMARQDQRACVPKWLHPLDQSLSYLAA